MVEKQDEYKAVILSAIQCLLNFFWQKGFPQEAIRIAEQTKILLKLPGGRLHRMDIYAALENARLAAKRESEEARRLLLALILELEREEKTKRQELEAFNKPPHAQPPQEKPSCFARLRAKLWRPLHAKQKKNPSACNEGRHV
jgi:hypothetical protein